MAFKIAVASGKGGTGKTTVSVNLFLLLQKNKDVKVHLVDCDVEEPNDILFFNDAIITEKREISQLIPVIDKVKCTFCRKCSSYCEFNAIVVIPPVNFAEVNANLCHSCGACSVACPEGAITELPEPIGKVNFFKTTNSYEIAEGKLKIGSAMQTMLIKELKKNSSDNYDVIIYDAPPGTSCPVVETISDVDFLVLVTEPTPFGMHDLKLMIELVRELGIPFGVVINKSGLGSNEIYTYLEKEEIDILAQIPFSREYARLYSNGELEENVPNIIEDAYQNMLNSLQEKLAQYEGNHSFKW